MRTLATLWAPPGSGGLKPLDQQTALGAFPVCLERCWQQKQQLLQPQRVSAPRMLCLAETKIVHLNAHLLETQIGLCVALLRFRYARPRHCEG
jgi:hypothetical protein